MIAGALPPPQKLHSAVPGAAARVALLLAATAAPPGYDDVRDAAAACDDAWVREVVDAVTPGGLVGGAVWGAGERLKEGFVRVVGKGGGPLELVELVPEDDAAFLGVGGRDGGVPVFAAVGGVDYKVKPGGGRWKGELAGEGAGDKSATSVAAAKRPSVPPGATRRGVLPKHSGTNAFGGNAMVALGGASRRNAQRERTGAGSAMPSLAESLATARGLKRRTSDPGPEGQLSQVGAHPKKKERHSVLQIDDNELADVGMDDTGYAKKKRDEEAREKKNEQAILAKKAKAERVARKKQKAKNVRMKKQHVTARRTGRNVLQNTASDSEGDESEQDTDNEIDSDGGVAATDVGGAESPAGGENDTAIDLVGEGNVESAQSPRTAHAGSGRPLRSPRTRRAVPPRAGANRPGLQRRKTAGVIHDERHVPPSHEREGLGATGPIRETPNNGFTSGRIPRGGVHGNDNSSHRIRSTAHNMGPPKKSYNFHSREAAANTYAPSAGRGPLPGNYIGRNADADTGHRDRRSFDHSLSTAQRQLESMPLTSPEQLSRPPLDARNGAVPGSSYTYADPGLRQGDRGPPSQIDAVNPQLFAPPRARRVPPGMSQIYEAMGNNRNMLTPEMEADLFDFVEGGRGMFQAHQQFVELVVHALDDQYMYVLRLDMNGTWQLVRTARPVPPERQIAHY